MVTGDNIQTAQAIALECGILSPAQDVTEPTIIEGRVFRALTEKEREQVARKIMVSIYYVSILALDPVIFLKCRAYLLIQALKSA